MDGNRDVDESKKKEETNNKRRVYVNSKEKGGNSSVTEQLIADKYRLLKKIGAGSFGVVYHAINITNNREVAVKLEVAEGSHVQSQYESRVYKFLADGKHVPFARLYDTGDFKRALVMDLLGPSLEELFNFCDRKFSLKTVCMLADQMISVIEYVHQNNIVHCDIKPDNFLMGLSHQSNRVFIIDFGLSKQYRTGISLNHVKYSNNRSLTGTARYASINAHVGIMQSRRDDLESIGYVLVYFCVPKLPWQGINCKGRKQKYDRICEKKLSTSPEALCQGLPSEFNMYVKYCRSLRYDENPDYQLLRSIFRSILRLIKQKYDLMFDWREPKYANTMKEYLVTTSPSFANFMLSIDPQLVQSVDRDKPLPELVSNFLLKHPEITVEKLTFSIKNFYRNYLSIPLDCFVGTSRSSHEVNRSQTSKVQNSVDFKK